MFRCPIQLGVCHLGAIRAVVRRADGDLLGAGRLAASAGPDRERTARLSLLLGQPVKLLSLRHLSPSAVLYEGLEIHDPETAAVLVRRDRLRVARQSSSLDKSGKLVDRGLRLTAGQLAIGAESMRSLWPLMERLLQRRMGEGPPQIDLVRNRWQSPARRRFSRSSRFAAG